MGALPMYPGVSWLALPMSSVGCKARGAGVAPCALPPFLLLAAACALLFLLVAAPQARAHSRHEGSVEIFRGASGPYDLLVEAVPSVGFLEVTVVFEPGASGAALPYEPRVLVSAMRGGERLGPASAVRVAPNEYAVVLAPELAGEWSLLIAIDSDAGSASLDIPLAIAGPSAGVPWTAIAAGVGLVLPILWLIFWPRKRAARPA